MNVPLDVVTSWGRAGIFLTVLLGAAGVGRSLTGPASLAGYGWRGAVAHLILGLLAYATAFGLLAQLHTPHHVALGILVTVCALGLLSGLWASWRHDARMQVLLALGLSAAFAVAGAVRVNPNAADPLIYAYTSSLAFRENWSSTGLPHVPGLREFLAENLMTRASSLALLWPLSLPGWGLSANVVGQVAAWLMLSVFLLVVDILPSRAPLLVRCVIATGALGVFDEVAVLTGGQINQAFALASVVSTLWISRHIRARFIQVLALALSGAVIFGGYPEFSLALPLYILGVALLQRASWRQLGIDILAVSVGGGAVQLTTRLANAEWLLSQLDALPAWWPLPNEPHNLVDVWVAITLQRGVPWYVLALVAAGLFLWTRRHPLGVFAPGPVSRTPHVEWAIAALVGLLAIWSIIVLRAPNVNYATFKIGGWIGPGLFVVTWLLLERCGALVGRAGASLLVALAMFRTSALVIDAPPKLLLYGTQHPSAAWRVQTGKRADDCLVLVSSVEPRVIMQALAESGAPNRGCAVTAEPEPPPSL